MALLQEHLNRLHASILVADIERSAPYDANKHPRGANGRFIGTGGHDIAKISGVKTEVALSTHQMRTPAQYDAKRGEGAHAKRLVSLQARAGSAKPLTSEERSVLSEHVKTLSTDLEELTAKAAEAKPGSAQEKAIRAEMVRRATTQAAILQRLERDSRATKSASKAGTKPVAKATKGLKSGAKTPKIGTKPAIPGAKHGKAGKTPARHPAHETAHRILSSLTKMLEEQAKALVAQAHGGVATRAREGQPIRHVRKSGNGHILTYKSGLAEQQFATHNALPRYVYWDSYLRTKSIPTRKSTERALHVIRGHIRWRMARRAQDLGYDLSDIPSAMLANPRYDMRHATRADIPDDLGDEIDPVDFWDQADVQDYLANAEIWDDTRSNLTSDDLAQIYADIDLSIEFDDWIKHTFLKDVQVLQLLDGFYNMQAATMAGQEFLNAAGLVGDFSLVDPNTESYLQLMSGALITRINETTRQQAAEALWKGFTGPNGEPLAVDGIARYLRSEMDNLGNALAGMSRYRAQMIAVTEVARAETFGNYVAMLQSGVRKVQWLTTVGACGKCADNELQGPISILTPFPSGDFAPPGHPMCRCTVTAYVDGTWDARDWDWSPDPAQLDRLFSDPSFMLWPRQMIDLEMPQLQMIDPQKASLLQFDDLPAKLQQMLTPDAIDMIQRQLGNVIDLDDFAARLEAFAQSHKAIPDIPDSSPTPASEASAELITLDSILKSAPDMSDQMTDIEKRAVDKLEQTLRDIGKDLGLSGNEDGQRAIIPHLRVLRLQLAEQTRRGVPVYGAGHKIIGNVGEGIKTEDIKPPSVRGPKMSPVKGMSTPKASAATPKTNASLTPHNISVKDIHVGLNPRETFDPAKLQELAESIKEHGLIQPITVRPHEGGYQLIAGERRFRAMQMLGYEHVPAIVQKVDDATARQLALVENISRADMTMLETAKAYQAILSGNKTMADLKKLTGKTTAELQRHLDLLALPDHLQKLYDQGKLNASYVSDMVKLSKSGQEEAASRILEGDLGAKNAKGVIRAIYNREHQTTMFAETGPSKAAVSARQKYDTIMQSLTDQLSKLDDEEIALMAQGIDSTSREMQRLELMINQLRRMRSSVESEGHRRTVSRSRAAMGELSGRLLYIRLALAEQTRYTYIDSHDNTHLVGQDAQGKWISNEIISHGMDLPQPPKMPSPHGMGEHFSAAKGGGGGKKIPSVPKPSTPKVGTPVNNDAPRPWEGKQDVFWLAREWEARIGTHATSITVAPLKSTWGQVDPGKHVTINEDVLKLPRSLAEYVIAHEMVHVLAPSAGHGTLFGLYMSAYMSDWQEREKALRAYETTVLGTKAAGKTFREGTGAKAKPTGTAKTTGAKKSTTTSEKPIVIRTEKGGLTGGPRLEQQLRGYNIDRAMKAAGIDQKLSYDAKRAAAVQAIHAMDEKARSAAKALTPTQRQALQAERDRLLAEGNKTSWWDDKFPKMREELAAIDSHLARTVETPLTRENLEGIFKETLAGDIYQDSAGNYRYYSSTPEYSMEIRPGQAHGAITPWSESIRATYPTQDELRHAAHEGAHLNQDQQARALWQLSEKEKGLAAYVGVRKPAAYDTVSERIKSGDMSPPPLIPASGNERILNMNNRVSQNDETLGLWREIIGDTITPQQLATYDTYAQQAKQEHDALNDLSRRIPLRDINMLTVPEATKIANIGENHPARADIEAGKFVALQGRNGNVLIVRSGIDPSVTYRATYTVDSAHATGVHETNSASVVGYAYHNRSPQGLTYILGSNPHVLQTFESRGEADKYLKASDAYKRGRVDGLQEILTNARKDLLLQQHYLDEEKKANPNGWRVKDYTSKVRKAKLAVTKAEQALATEKGTTVEEEHKGRLATLTASLATKSLDELQQLAASLGLPTTGAVKTLARRIAAQQVKSGMLFRSQLADRLALLHTALIVRGFNPDQPRGPNGKFLPTGDHPTNARGAPVGGKGYSAYRELQRINQHGAADVGLHGKALIDHLNQLHLHATGRQQFSDLHALNYLYHRYQHVLSMAHDGRLKTETQSRLPDATYKRITAEMKTIRSYLTHHGYQISKGEKGQGIASAGKLISQADRDQITNSMNEIINREYDEDIQRMQLAEETRTIEYIDSHGNTHLVGQDAQGRWISNEVISHGIALPQAPTIPSPHGLPTHFATGKSSGGAKVSSAHETPAKSSKDLYRESLAQGKYIVFSMPTSDIEERHPTIFSGMDIAHLAKRDDGDSQFSHWSLRDVLTASKDTGKPFYSVTTKASDDPVNLYTRLFDNSSHQFIGAFDSLQEASKYIRSAPESYAEGLRAVSHAIPLAEEKVTKYSTDYSSRGQKELKTAQRELASYQKQQATFQAKLDELQQKPTAENAQVKKSGSKAAKEKPLTPEQTKAIADKAAGRYIKIFTHDYSHQVSQSGRASLDTPFQRAVNKEQLRTLKGTITPPPLTKPAEKETAAKALERINSDRVRTQLWLQHGPGKDRRTPAALKQQATNQIAALRAQESGAQAKVREEAQSRLTSTRPKGTITTTKNGIVRLNDYTDPETLRSLPIVHDIVSGAVHVPTVSEWEAAQKEGKYLGDVFQTRLLHELGLDARPQVVTAPELNATIAKGQPEMWRGVAQQSHAEDLVSGAFQPGMGKMGNGLHVYVDLTPKEESFTFSHYGGEAGVNMRMSLKDGARITTAGAVEQAINRTSTAIRLHYTDLIAAAPDRTSRLALTRERDAILQLIRDPGRMTALMGYDAVIDNSSGFTQKDLASARKGTLRESDANGHIMLVVNRSALVVQRPFYTSDQQAKAAADRKLVPATTEKDDGYSIKTSPLIPIVSAGEVSIGRYDTPSAYILQKLYGNEQLHAALRGYTTETLKDMAREVQGRNEGTKPQSMASRKHLIDYIEQYVTGKAQGGPAEVHPLANGELPRPVQTISPHEINPYGTPDLALLTRSYGEHQIGAVLSTFTTPVLKEMAAANGVKGTNRASLISALTTHATQGRYSANFGAKASSTSTKPGQEAVSPLQTLITSASAQYTKELASALHPESLRIFYKENPAYQGGKELPGQITLDQVRQEIRDTGSLRSGGVGYARRLLTDTDVTEYVTRAASRLATERALDAAFGRTSTDITVEALAKAALAEAKQHNVDVRESAAKREQAAAKEKADFFTSLQSQSKAEMRVTLAGYAVSDLQSMASAQGIQTEGLSKARLISALIKKASSAQRVVADKIVQLQTILTAYQRVA